MYKFFTIILGILVGFLISTGLAGLFSAGEAWNFHSFGLFSWICWGVWHTVGCICGGLIAYEED